MVKQIHINTQEPTSQEAAVSDAPSPKPDAMWREFVAKFVIEFRGCHHSSCPMAFDKGPCTCSAGGLIDDAETALKEHRDR